MADTANVLVGVAEVTVGEGSSAHVIGYTVDGVVMTVSSEYAEIRVEENEGSIIRRLIDQNVQVTLNMAEGDLTGLSEALPGSSLVGNTLTLGGSDLQEYRLTLKGTTPAGRDRVIILTAVNPTGEVGIPYKKGEVSVVPVTYSALVDDDGEFGYNTDANTDAPTFVSAATDVGGTEIVITFSKNMAASTGKHGEFWFTRGVTTYQFTGAVTSSNKITLSIAVPDKVLNGETVKVSYRLGSISSADVGILASFTDAVVTNNVP